MPQSRRGFLGFSRLGLLPVSFGVPGSARMGNGAKDIAVVDKVAHLAQISKEPMEPQLAVVLGASQPFDGGGGFYLRVPQGSGAQLQGAALTDALSEAKDWYRLLDKSFLGEAPTAKAFGALGDIKADDTAAIQALIQRVGTYAGDLGKAGYIPAGLYRLSHSLIPQSYSRIFGDGPHQSVLYNFQNPLPTIPAFRADEGLTFSTFENLGMQSYRAGFDISGPTDHNTFRDLKLYGMADAGFHFHGPLQTSVFDRILFEHCEYGLICDDQIVNRSTFREPEFKDCRYSAIQVNGAEDLLILGGRFEGSGVAGRAILNTRNVHLMSFVGGYFEGCHEYLLRARDSQGIISFESVHFTYFREGTPYKWDVDSGCKLVFRNCHSTLPMNIPSSSVLEGLNHNIRAA